jgi:multidrug resistance efflux pump
MIELIVGTYGVACWLVFKKFKLIPVNAYTVCTAFLGGIGILLMLYVLLSVYHPVGHDARMYAPVVQIVPNVRGLVIEVPVEANQPIKKGDVLFKIDPEPFRIEVSRLRALLESKNVKAFQLSESLAQARAATAEARSNLVVAESDFDRQVKESAKQAAAREIQVSKRLDLAKKRFARSEELVRNKSVSQEDYDRDKTAMLNLEIEMNDATSGRIKADEKVKSGTASLDAFQKDVDQLEAAERSIERQVNTQIEGVNPEVREVMAQLEKARWDLDQTVVRAPADGYVPQLTLRPGQMAVSLPFKPLMVFVVTERPTLIATLPQKSISDVKPGLDAEVVFDAYPGRSFKIKVRRVMTALPEGEILASGEILPPTPESAPGRVPVVFDYGEDIAALNLPVGAKGSIAVYTERVHALSIVRKIVLRMKSWESYLF